MEPGDDPGSAFPFRRGFLIFFLGQNFGESNSKLQDSSSEPCQAAGAVSLPAARRRFAARGPGRSPSTLRDAEGAPLAAATWPQGGSSKAAWIHEEEVEGCMK